MSIDLNETGQKGKGNRVKAELEAILSPHARDRVKITVQKDNAQLTKVRCDVKLGEHGHGGDAVPEGSA